MSRCCGDEKYRKRATAKKAWRMKAGGVDGVAMAAASSLAPSYGANAGALASGGRDIWRVRRA